MNTLFANKQKGLSLIELMISVALGIVITFSVVTIYSDNLQSYRVQDSLSRLQENGRFAMHLLAQDIRMADHTGCAKTPLAALGIAGVVGIDGTNGTTTVAATEHDEPDTITVGFAKIKNGTVMKVGLWYRESRSTFVLFGNFTEPEFGPGFFVLNDKIVTSDCSGATAFNTTLVKQRGDVNLESTLPLTLNEKIAFESKNADLLFLSTAEYKIDNPDGSATLHVKRNGRRREPVVDGVENMQILYGQNSRANANSHYLPADSVDMEDINSVKISLVLASSDNIATKPVPYTIFGKEVTPTDRKIRQVFTQTIALRNRLP